MRSGGQWVVRCPGVNVLNLPPKKCLLQHHLEMSVSSLDIALSFLKSRRVRRVRDGNVILSGTVPPT